MSGGVLQAQAWDQDASWDSGAKPVTDDPAIVSETLAATSTVTDASGAASTVDLDLLQTHPLFAGSFGTSGSPIVSAADLVQVYGPGGFYFECTANGLAWKTDRVEIAPADIGAPIELGSESGDAGDYVDIYALRGKILLKGNTQFDAAGRVIVGSIRTDSDVRLQIASGADDLATLDVRSGTVEALNVVTNLRQAGGTVIKDDAKAVNVELFGGTLFYDHAAVSGDGTTIRVHRGATLHLWRNAVQKIIPNVILLPGSIIVFSPHTKLHNILNLIDMGARRITSEGPARQLAAAVA